jgi:hypothetical protein
VYKFQLPFAPENKAASSFPLGQLEKRNSNNNEKYNKNIN